MGHGLCPKEGLNLGFEVEAWLECVNALHFEELGAPEEGGLGTFF